MAYKVELASAGNPDFGEDPRRPKPGARGRTIKVRNLAEASAKCREFIEANGLGGGNWSGGKITDENGVEIGNISYNGAVWPPGGFRLNSEPIYRPGGRIAAPAVVDPLAWEEAQIELPGYGLIKLGGCLRHGTIGSVPGKFKVDGKRVEFMDIVVFDGKGAAEMFRDRFSLHPDGVLTGMPLRFSDDAWKLLVETVSAWAASPEGLKLVLSNTVKDVKRDDNFHRGAIERAEASIVEERAAIAANAGKIAELEERIAAIEPDSTQGFAP